MTNGAPLASPPSAGAMHAPSESPSTSRVCTGTAPSPKAGTKVTAGVARAMPSAQARGSIPLAATTAPRASSRLGDGWTGTMAIDAGAEGALTVARPEDQHGLGYFHSRIRYGTSHLQ